MSVTLNTQLENLMFSSQIPDLDLTTSDDNEAVVSIVSGGATVFSATHIPYQRNIIVHDIRSVVEYYMRQGSHALRSFTLRAKHNGSTQTLATFQAVYLEQHFTGDTEEFLRNNFLTTMEGKLMAPGATEFLYYYKKAYSQESVRFRVVASVYDEEPRVFQYSPQMSINTNDSISKVEVNMKVMLDAVESHGWVREHIRPLACSVQVGARSFTFYVQDCEPNLTLYFRNAFNCFECCALQAVTTHKPKVDRSIAVTNRISTFYNQQNEKLYEVETSGLTMEQARWIEQLFYSHDVRMATKRTDFSQGYTPQGMPIVLITEPTCEISDADGELNTVKFTYQYQDRRTYLPTDYLSVDHDRIFTEQFDPSFQ